MSPIKVITENLLNKSILFIPLLLLIVTNMTACSSTHRIHAGSETLFKHTDILETSLHLGRSDMDDVLQVLGKPNGKGGFMLPSDPVGRTTWSYFYDKISAEIYENYLEGEGTRIFLFIYFDSNDKYDGYMWFSGTTDIEADF
jgi:hypothetical protein